jgi:hypothetical protein
MKATPCLLAIVLGACVWAPPTSALAANSSTTITLSPQSSWALGSDEWSTCGPSTAVPCPANTFPLVTNATTRLGGSLTETIGKFSFGVSRSYLDFQLGRVTDYAGKFVYPGYADDAVSTASASYNFGILTASGGYTQRIRWCCPSGNTAAANPLAYEWWWIQVSKGFGPKTKFGNWLTLSANQAFVPHSTSPVFQDPNFAPNTGHYILAEKGNTFTTFTGELEIPVDKSQSFAPFISYANNWEYWEAFAIPIFYNNVTYGITKVFTPNISYTASVTNYYQHNQGYPFAYPNSINLTFLQMVANFSLTF